MAAGKERLSATTRVDKAAGFIQSWLRTVSAQPALAERCRHNLVQALQRHGFRLPADGVAATPFILDANAVRELTRRVRALCAVFERLNQLALSNVAFLRRLEISAPFEALLRREPERRLSFELARLDFAPHPHGLQLVALECDVPAGATLAGVLQRAFLDEEACRAAGLDRLLPSAPTPALLADLCLAAWREAEGDGAQAPRIALLDWRESPPCAAQRLLLEEFRARNLKAQRTDPRDFTFNRERGALLFGDSTINLVVRDISVPEISVRRLPLAAYLEAASANAVVSINALRSRPASTSAALEVLTSSAFDGFFTAADNEIKARMLPWTRKLIRGSTDYRGREVDLPSFVSARPQRFVLRTTDGVSVWGGSVSQGQWQALLDSGLGRGMVVQEYVPLPEVPTDHSGEQTAAPRVLLGAFAVRGEYAGCAAWCGPYTLIDPQQAALMPVLEMGGRSKTGPLEAGRPTRKRKPTATRPN